MRQGTQDGLVGANSPVRLNFAISQGALSTDLRVTFRRAAPARGDRPAVAARTIISGRFEVTGFGLAARAAQPKPLLAWKSLAVVLEEVEPFVPRAVIGDVALVAPTIDVVRDATGALNWVQFIRQPSQAAPAPPAATAAAPAANPAATAPLAVTLRHASVRNGTVNLADDSAGMFRLQAVSVQADATNLTTTAPDRGKVQLKFDVAEGGGTASLDGDVGLAPLGGSLALAVRNTRLRAPARYLAHVVNGTLDGSSDVDGVLEFAAAEPAFKVALRDLAVQVDRHDEGRKAGWGAKPLTGTMPMPVPASYNDITHDPTIRDHIGDVWYQREFFVPAGWQGKRVELRAGAASYAAILFVNSQEVAQHKGGFLPFGADVSDIVRYGEPNRVTLCVNNVLDYQTLPTGKVNVFNDDTHPPGMKVQTYQQDFFNYAGIHRPVRLICTPKVRISDVTVVTDVDGSTGIVNYTVAIEGGDRQVRVTLADADGKQVAAGDGLTGKLTVADAQLWQPGKAYLYTLRIETVTGKTVEDVYSLPVGIRTVADRFFAFLHLYEPHSPYTPPARYARLAPYDGEIAYADELAGRLLDHLRARNLYDRSIIVVTSDHGEGLGQHGEAEHGIFLYREAVRVPLVVRLPGGARGGTRVAGAVAEVDIPATILDLSGVPSTGLDGASLRDAMSARVARPGRVYSETLYGRFHFGWSELYAATEGRFRYIKAPRPELYDVDSDPGETQNLAQTRRQVTADLDAWLLHLHDRQPVPSPACSQADSDRSIGL